MQGHIVQGLLLEGFVGGNPQSSDKCDQITM